MVNHRLAPFARTHPIEEREYSALQVLVAATGLAEERQRRHVRRLGVFAGYRAPSRYLLHSGKEFLLALHLEHLKFGERDFWIMVVFVALETKKRLLSLRPCRLEKTLVHIANLLHVKRTERKRNRAVLGLENLQGLQQQKNRSVVDREWRRILHIPGDIAAAAFEKRILVGIEQAAAHRGHPEKRMVNPRIDGAEEAQQPYPCVKAAFQHLIAKLVPIRLKPPPQRGDRVCVVVCRLAKEQKPSLLRREDEHEAHHHGERRLVERFRRYVAKKRPLGIKVCAVKSFEQDFHRSHHLLAERIGNFVKMLQRLVEKSGERLVLCAREPVEPKEREESPKRGILLEPQSRVPRRASGKRTALGGVHENPLLAVRNEPEACAARATEARHFLDKRILPFVRGVASMRQNTWRKNLDEEVDLVAEYL